MIAPALAEGRRAHLVALAIATFVGLLAVVAARPVTAGAQVTASFGTPLPIDDAAPFGDPWTALAVACAPSSTHCVGLGDQDGGALQQTTADAGTSGQPTWSTPADIAGLTGFTPTQMSCASAALCVAVGVQNGQPATVAATASNDGGTTWSAPAALEPYSSSDPPQALACTTTGRCVTVDTAGDAFYRDASTGAWSGPVSLTGLKPTPGLALASVACTGPDTCVIAATVRGTVAMLASDDMGDTTPQWTVTPIRHAGSIPVGVACTPDGTCAAIDNAQHVLISTDPAAASWTVTGADDSGSLAAIACPGEDECLITDGNGGARLMTGLASATPTVTSVNGPGDAAPLSCPSTTWCLAGLRGALYFGVLGASSATWMATAPSGLDPLTHLACAPSGGVCAAADSTGHVVASGDGGASWGSPTTWSASLVAAAALSCTADGMCAEIDGAGEVSVAEIGADGAAAWTQPTTTGGSGTVDGLSCVSAQLCVAVDSAGEARVSTDPAAADPTWTIVATGAATLRSVACPSAQLCVAGDARGDIWTTTDPAADDWTQAAAVDPGVAITALACPSAQLCVVGDGDGQVFDSFDPDGGAAAWSAPVATGASGAVTSLDCAAGGLCAGLAAGGEVVLGPSNASSGSWSPDATAPDDLTAVACPAAQACVFGDARGDAVPGALPAGAAAVSSAVLSFPATAIGQVSADETVTVTDSGGAPLTISGDALAGAGAGSFSIDDDECAGTTLVPGATCTIAVFFAPTASGVTSATLQITSDDPAGPAAVALSGTGVAASGDGGSGSTGGSGPAPSGTIRVGVTPAGRARFTRAAVTATLVDLIVRCAGSTGERCTVRLRLTAHEYRRRAELLRVSHSGRGGRGGRGERTTVRPVTLAAGTVTLAAGRGRIVHLALGTVGRRLLHRFGRLPVTLTASQILGRRVMRTHRFRLSFAAAGRR